MRVITGSARGVPLKAPEGLQTRPTADRVKEALFSIIQFEVSGAKVLDLFGGSGQLGIEALSRGAKSAVFVDAGEQACKIIKENLKRCKLENQSTVIKCDYMEFFKRNREQYSIIFLDPPYAEVFLETALKIVSEIDILTNSGIIVCERPFDKTLAGEVPGLVRYRDYRYGKAAVTIFRRG